MGAGRIRASRPSVAACHKLRAVAPARRVASVPGEVRAVFAAKAVRTFGYGFLGIVFPIHLAGLGVPAVGIGLSVSATLFASAALTWAVRRPAERFGARAVLLALAAATAVAGALLLFFREPWLVVVAAMLGNVSVSTGESGAFLSLEQVVLARALPPERRTWLFGVYNLLGAGAAALGSAAVGLSGSLTLLFALFIAGAGVQALAYRTLPRARPPAPAPVASGGSGPLVRRLAALFALDSFAGGFALQSLVAYWLHERFALSLGDLGSVFFAVQVLTALSQLLAARLGGRFGLLHTMVFTHLIANLLLIGLALAPSPEIAIALLLGRGLLSQMDVPTRQAYVMALVEDREREAAASATTFARTLAQAVSPAATGWVMQAIALSAPFAIGGALKIAYDLMLWASFRKVPLRGDVP
jgi:MFS family permease